MSDHNDGGPAFPVPGFDYGMSVRDWFAGQALAGIMAATSNVSNACSVGSAAGWAYEIADAMLAAREEKR